MGSGFGLDEFHAVVRSDGRWGGRVQGVQHAHGVRLVGELGDFLAGGPAQGAGLVTGGGASVDRLAAEDERDDQAGHVLVDAGQGRRKGDLDAGLFEDLALKGLGDGLPGFENAARRLPVPVVPALDQQGPAAVVDDDSGDAHGMGAFSGTHVLDPLAWLGSPP